MDCRLLCRRSFSPRLSLAVSHWLSLTGRGGTAGCHLEARDRAFLVHEEEPLPIGGAAISRWDRVVYLRPGETHASLHPGCSGELKRKDRHGIER